MSTFVASMLRGVATGAIGLAWALREGPALWRARAARRAAHAAPKWRL